MVVMYLFFDAISVCLSQGMIISVCVHVELHILILKLLYDTFWL